MRAVIIVGLGFGDEGKGATVDALVRQHNAKLVVRYSGGPQCGHRVELPDGTAHIFAQFGSGTLAGASTYIGPKVIISLEALEREAQALQKIGISNPYALLSVFPGCLIATRYHVALNRLLEGARGAARHGSCGMGVGVTRQLAQVTGCHLHLRDFEGSPSLNWLIEQLELTRAVCRHMFAEELYPQETRTGEEYDGTLPPPPPHLSEQLHGEWELLNSDEPPVELAAQMREIASKVSTGLFPAVYGELDAPVIFEGAQGVLLDENWGFHPHTTWSTVTQQHALELLKSTYKPWQVSVLGVIRTYHTRHGEGPLPTHVPGLAETRVDKCNATNPWQGDIRHGHFDLPLFRYAMEVVKPDGLVVNCCDHSSNTYYCPEYREHFPNRIDTSLANGERIGRFLQTAKPILLPAENSQDILGVLRFQDAPVVLEGWGPTHEDRKWNGFVLPYRDLENVREKVEA